MPCRAVRVPRAQRSLDAAQRQPAAVWGPVSGRGCRLGGRPSRPLLACWRPLLADPEQAPAGGSLPSPSVKPTSSAQLAVSGGLGRPAVAAAAVGVGTPGGGDCGRRSRQPAPPGPVASCASRGWPHRPSEGPETDPGLTACAPPPPPAGEGAVAQDPWKGEGPPQPWGRMGGTGQRMC